MTHFASLRLLIALTALISLCSCASIYRDPDDPDSNRVEYQFIDAETMKPIQGAYVNAVWVSPTPAGKVNGSECLQAALLRSDAGGWVRMDGPKGSILEMPWIMVPGYEHFEYFYENQDPQHVAQDNAHVLHVIREEQQGLDLYPAWADRLIGMGYTFQGNTFEDPYPYSGFYKLFPIDGFVDNTARPRAAQRYYVSNRSLPGRAYLVNVANACGPGGVNIGLSDEQRKETGDRRALHQLQVVCDERWDTTPGPYPPNSMTQALWLVEAPMENAEAWNRVKEVIPTFQGRTDNRIKMTKAERVAFCAWMKPFAQAYK